jgi:DNA-binding CsgD family transcriptional regulator
MSASIFELIDGISKSTRFEQGHALLRNAIVDMGLAHVAYAAVNLPSIKHARPLIAVTYAPEWQKHYVQSNYVNIDPVVRAGLGGILPVDWSTIESDDPLVLKFFGEAQEFKIGRAGLSFPIRGRHNEFALFSVSANLGPREWEQRKNSLSRDLMLLAYQFHDWALKVEGIKRNDFVNMLSVREKDCLRWRAEGKTDWEISQLVHISERTVKFHLESSRAKLGASNTIHAVAKAIGHGLISIP